MCHKALNILSLLKGPTDTYRKRDRKKEIFDVETVRRRKTLQF